MKSNRKNFIMSVFLAVFALFSIAINAMSIKDIVKSSRSYMPILLTATYGGSLKDVQACAQRIKLNQKIALIKAKVEQEKQAALLKAMEEERQKQKMAQDLLDQQRSAQDFINQKEQQKTVIKNVRKIYREIDRAAGEDKKRYNPDSINKKELKALILSFEHHLDAIKNVYEDFLIDQKKGAFTLLGDYSKYLDFDKQCIDLSNAIDSFLLKLKDRYAYLEKQEEIYSNSWRALNQPDVLVPISNEQRTHRDALYVKINHFLDTYNSVTLDHQNKEAVITEIEKLFKELDDMQKVGFNSQSAKLSKVRKDLNALYVDLQADPVEKGSAKIEMNKLNKSAKRLNYLNQLLYMFPSLSTFKY